MPSSRVIQHNPLMSMYHIVSSPTTMKPVAA
jgi:hypothetical protein